MKSLLENFTGGKKQYEELKDNQKILLTKAVHDDLRKSENFGDLNLLRTANSINENKIGLRQENKDQYKNTLSKMDQIIFDHSEELVNLKSDFDTNPNSYQMSSHQANVMQKFYSRLNKITKEKTNHRSRNLNRTPFLNKNSLPN